MTLEVGDIEDGVGAVEPARVALLGRVRKRRERTEATVKTEAIVRTEATPDGSFIPGQARVYLRTWGCSHNGSDSEYMAGLLAAAGYSVSTASKEGADVWLLNSCTVKTPSEAAIANHLKEAESAGVPVVVAGCVPQADRGADWLQPRSLLGTAQIDRVVEVVEATLQGQKVHLLSTRGSSGRRRAGPELSLPKIRRNPLVEILSVNTGCLNHCTYCKTKQARGDLVSYPIEELVDRAVQSFAEGVREIWLTSEDLGAYGRDFGATLPELLRELVAVIPPDCRLRLGMTNPPYILDHLEEMAEILRHPRVYRFLHIPVQSGADPVLLDMRREYNSNDFRRVCDFLLQAVPDIYIATDVIAGFPTESSEDWEETMQLVRHYRFPSLFINQFFPRPNTPAARMKRIATTEVKRRTGELSRLFASYSRYQGRRGSAVRVLVTEVAADRVSLVGHTASYEQVLLPASPCLMGAMTRATVTDESKFSLRARPWLRDWIPLWLAFQARRLRPSLPLILPASAVAFVLARLVMRRLKL